MTEFRRSFSIEDDVALNKFDVKLKKKVTFKSFLRRIIEVIDFNKSNKKLKNLLTGYLIMQITLSNITNARISIFGSIAPILVAIRKKYSLTDIKRLIDILINEDSDIDIYFNGEYEVLYDEFSNMEVLLKIEEDEEEPSLIDICLTKEAILNKCELTINVEEWFDLLNPLISDLLIENPIILRYIEEYEPIPLDIVSLRSGIEFCTLYQTPRLTIFSINFRPCTVFATGDILEYTEN